MFNKRFIIFLFISKIVFSDIAPTEYKGYSLSPYNENNVSLKSEKVDIYWNNICEVNAVFNLQNASKEEIDLKIGFPVNLSYFKYSKRAKIDSINRIYDFEFDLNGMVLKETDVPEKSIRSDKEYWYGWDCKLKPGLNIVTLKYKVKTNSSYGYGWKRNLHYVLYTGKFWQGNIEKATVTIHFPQEFSAEQVLKETSPKNYKILSKSISWNFKNLKPSPKDNIHLQVISFPIFNKIKKYDRLHSNSDVLPDKKLEMAEFYAGLAPGKGLHFSVPYAFSYTYFNDTLLNIVNTIEKKIIKHTYKLKENDNNVRFYSVKNWEDFRENDSIQNAIQQILHRIQYFKTVKYPENYHFIQRSKKLYNEITTFNPSNCTFWLSYLNHYYLIEDGGAQPCIPYVGAEDFSEKQKILINRAKKYCNSNKKIDLLFLHIHPELAELPDTIGKKENSDYKNKYAILIKSRCNQCWSTAELTETEMNLIKKKYDVAKNSFIVKTNREITNSDSMKIINVLYKYRYYKYDYCRKLQRLK